MRVAVAARAASVTSSRANGAVGASVVQSTAAGLVSRPLTAVVSPTVASPPERSSRTMAAAPWSA